MGVFERLAGAGSPKIRLSGEGWESRAPWLIATVLCATVILAVTWGLLRPARTVLPPALPVLAWPADRWPVQIPAQLGSGDPPVDFAAADALPPNPRRRLVQPALQAAPKPTEKLVNHRDPVCGPKGREWYRNERGWRYWRCRR